MVLHSGRYLACCYKVLERVYGQTEDVVIVAHVKPLRVLLPVVNDSHGSCVIDDLSSLGVEQVAPAVVASVAVKRTRRNHE